MKKTLIKRGLIFITVLMLMLSVTVTAFASEPTATLQQSNGVTPFFVGLNIIAYNFDIVSGQANPVIKGTTYSGAVDYVNVAVTLKRSSGSTWTTVKSWSKNITISLDQFAFNEKYSVSSGYSYKYTATVKSYKNGSLLDTVTFDSKTIVY
jgi:hypothetical protein